MPRLRRYVTGEGYYLTDYLYGTGYCTWQIAEQGLSYLRSRGICQDNDHVTGADRNHLLKRELIWRTGTGVRVPGSADGPALPPEVAALAVGLRAWAGSGGVPALTALLYGRSGDHRDRCFPPAFLGWLSKLDRGISLADLDCLSALDFDDIACPALQRLVDPLHQHFAAQGDTHVLWQLGRVVGLVARQRRGSSSCPAAWGAGQPVLQRLFVVLGQLAPADREPRAGCGRPRPSTRLLAQRPSLHWDVDFQQVVAVLPEQVLPAEIEGLTWCVSPGGCEQPRLWPVDGGRRVEEACSHALPPAPCYRVDLTFRGKGVTGVRVESFHLSLPDGLDPCVLFGANGTLAGCEGEVHHAGEYLALVPADSRAPFFLRRGVRAIERVPVAPAGWRGWEGWHVALAPNADLAPYRVEAGGATLGWELEPPSTPDVIWREPHPVWVSAWPRVFVSAPAGFEGAVLEVYRDGGTDAGHEPLRVVVGRDIPVADEAGSERWFIDLSRSKALGQVFGTVRLECRLPAYPDHPPLQARLVRLPALKARYVPDPAAPDRFTAVELAVSGSPSLKVVPEGDTEVGPGAGGVVLRAKQPVNSPGVTARLPQYRATLRVRVPTTRAGLIAPDRGFTGWQTLPINGLDLAKVGVHDKLRVELHEPPCTEDGQLLCRLLGGCEVAAGSPLREQSALNAFEIDLHRWRDTLGLSAQGVVQVRGRNQWVELTRLKELPPEAATTPPAPTVAVSGDRGRLVLKLEASLNQADSAGVIRLAGECLDRAGRPSATAIDRELLPLAAARALILVAVSAEPLQQARDCLVGLAGRDDLGEARLLRETALLRLSCRSEGGELMSRERISRMEHGLAECPRKLLLLAECHYHMARDSRCEPEACWRSCAELSDRYLASRAAGRDLPERGEAMLMREVSRLMLGLEPAAGSGAGEGPAPWGVVGPWAAAARLAAGYVRGVRTRERKASAHGRELDRSPAPQVLRPEDEDLLRLVVAQAAGQKTASRLWERIKDWPPQRFFAIRLLRARQAVLEGRTTEARQEYDRLLQEAMTKGQDFFLDIVAAERPA